MRVVSWNLQNRVGDAARRQGDFLGSLDPRPDLVMLQEVNRRSIELVCAGAGLDWRRLAVDLREADPADTPVRQRGVAIAGRGDPPTELGVLERAPLPERTLHARVLVGGQPMHVASYHAPPGVSWFEKKPQQAVAFTEWLSAVEGPFILGADANTPKVDHPDFESTRTHWHTGDKHLKGATGDDVLWAATKIHGLEDALRRWFEQHPEELAEVRAARPLGPLAVSHHTGKRKTSPGTPRRFDSVWVSEHFDVLAVDYPYLRSLEAGSDHSAVVVDVAVRGSS